MIMQIPKSMAKLLSVFLTVLTLVLTPVLGLAEPVFFNTGEANQAVKEAAGGFMAGICHPDPDYKDIKKGWISARRRMFRRSSRSPVFTQRICRGS